MQVSSAIAQNRRTERPWGWFETVCVQEAARSSTSDPGQQIRLQRHRHRAEHRVVLLGTAHVSVGEQQLGLAAGQHVDIASGKVHRLTNQTKEAMEILEVQLGEQLDDADIERLQDDYGRV